MTSHFARFKPMWLRALIGYGLIMPLLVSGHAIVWLGEKTIDFALWLMDKQTRKFSGDKTK